MSDTWLVVMGMTVTPMWPAEGECDGTHPARTSGGSIINLYDLVAHCQSWVKPVEPS